MINPPAAALPLVEAFHRFTDPELLAPLNGRLPGRWCPHSGGPASRAINGFFEQLHRGELTCWARHESPVAPYRPIPAAAWAHLQIGDWQGNVLWREDWRPANVTRPSLQLARSDGKAFISQGAPVQVTRNRPCIVERWFDAQVAPTPTDAKAPKGGRPPEPYKEAVVREVLAWLDEEGEQRIAQVKRFLADRTAERDKHPADSTLRTWAREAITEHRRRCQDGQR